MGNWIEYIPGLRSESGQRVSGWRLQNGCEYLHGANRESLTLGGDISTTACRSFRHHASAHCFFHPGFMGVDPGEGRQNSQRGLAARGPLAFSNMASMLRTSRGELRGCGSPGG